LAAHPQLRLTPGGSLGKSRLRVGVLCNFFSNYIYYLFM